MIDLVSAKYDETFDFVPLGSKFTLVIYISSGNVRDRYIQNDTKLICQLSHNE